MWKLFDKISPKKKLAAYVDETINRLNDKYEFEVEAKIKIRIIDRKPEETELLPCEVEK